MSGTAAPVVYPLRHPVELRNAAGDVTETVTALTLRRLKGRDMRALDGAKGNGSMLLAMLGASAGMPPSTVDQLDAEDVAAAGELIADFLGGSLLTGVR